MNAAFNIKHYTYYKMDWNYIFGPVVGAAAKVTFDFALKYIKSKKTPSQALMDVESIYSDCMAPVLESTPAKSFLVYKTEDSGGKLVPGAQVYSSVVYEEYRSPLISVKRSYQNLMADQQYVKMLNAMNSEGAIRCIVSEMPEGYFKTQLQSEGIKYFEMFFIAQTNDKLFYGFISSMEEKKNFANPKERVVIDLSVNKMRNVFKQSVKYLK